MPFAEVLILAIGLGADAFSVAAGVGVCWYGRRQMFRLAFHFGLFQFFMPLIGWLLGGLATSFIGPLAKYVAAVILAFIGARMIYNVVVCDDDGVDAECDPTRGWSLIGLSVATSIDALGAGFGLGLISTGLLFACVVIGVVACVMTIVGMLMSKRLTLLFGRRIEAVGGAVLLFLAFKIGFFS
jgi:manganese efflux pump family protein